MHITGNLKTGENSKEKYKHSLFAEFNKTKSTIQEAQ